VSHRVFRVGLCLFYPCLVGATLREALSGQLGSGPLRSFHCLVINSVAMFSYPPSLVSLAYDNLVSYGSGLASAMSVQSSVRTGEEEHIVIGGGDVVVAFRDVQPRIVGRHLAS
jgi:hypothetical protein